MNLPQMSVKMSALPARYLEEKGSARWRRSLKFGSVREIRHSHIAPLISIHPGIATL